MGDVDEAVIRSVGNILRPELVEILRIGLSPRAHRLAGSAATVLQLYNTQAADVTTRTAKCATSVG